MQPVTYLFFNSGCRDAMTRYGEIFGSTPEIMTHGTLPASERAGMPPVPDDTVMHSALKIGEGWIYGSDDFSGNSPAMAGCNIALSLPDEERREFASKMALQLMSLIGEFDDEDDDDAAENFEKEIL